MDPFTAALIANTDRLKQHQRELGAMSLELKKKPYEVLKIHQKVKIKLKRPAFRKESIFQPSFSNDIHTITHIDKTSYPPVYTVSGTQKKFYSHHLLPIGDIQLDNFVPTQTKHKLLIQSVIATPDNSLLRSGTSRKLSSNFDDIKYKTLQDGQINLLSRKDLLLHKNLFGKNHLIFGPYFNEPQNKKYLI